MSNYCTSKNPFTSAPCIRKAHASFLHWDNTDQSWTSPGHAIPNGCQQNFSHPAHLWLSETNELVSGVVFACDGIPYIPDGVAMTKMLPPSVVNVLFNSIVQKAW